jgi:hypothetical protein
VTEGTLQLNGLEVRFLRGVRQSGANSVTDLGGATLQLGTTGSDAVFEMLGGVLKGGGTINGGLVNVGGRVEVGGTFLAQTLTVSGDYTQAGGGELRVTVWDVGGGDWRFGKLEVTGTAELAGDLVFSLPDGAPPATTTRVIITADSLTQTLGEPEGWDLLQIGDSLAAIKE